MTINTVSTLVQIRKNPGISKEQIAKNLKLTTDEVALCIKALLFQNLIKLNAKKQCEAVGELKDLAKSKAKKQTEPMGEPA